MRAWSSVITSSVESLDGCGQVKRRRECLERREPAEREAKVSGLLDHVSGQRECPAAAEEVIRLHPLVELEAFGAHASLLGCPFAAPQRMSGVPSGS